jgi:DNA-binding transcriptional ArsR family regulator
MSGRYGGDMHAATFAALGEPSRLQIVELLRAGPLPVGGIAEQLDIRQPQVSKHLRVLKEAGVVVSDAVARQRIQRLEVAPFDEIGRWVGSFERLWDTRLDSLGRFLASIDTTADTTEDRTGKEGSR